MTYSEALRLAEALVPREAIKLRVVEVSSVGSGGWGITLTWTSPSQGEEVTSTFLLQDELV